MKTPAGVVVDRIHLGLVGRSREEMAESGCDYDLNKIISDAVPLLEGYIAAGALKPQPYEVVGGVGLESVLEGMKKQAAGVGGGKKVVVRIATE